MTEKHSRKYYNKWWQEIISRKGDKKLFQENERGEKKKKKRERDREREREINIIKIDTYLFLKGNQQIRLGRFRQNITEKVT